MERKAETQGQDPGKQSCQPSSTCDEAEIWWKTED